MWKALLLTYFAVGVFARNIGHADNEQNLQATNEISKSLDEHQYRLSLETLTNCIFGLYDFNIDEEVAKALPNGTLNEVSRKICRKATEIKTCYHNMADALFEDQLKRSIAKNIWDNMVDFACFMNGDITTKFIQDGGIECITSKPEALSRSSTGCMNNSGNVSSIAQACAKYDEISNCVVSTLRDCATTTPSNTARALFSYIRTKVLTPCSDNDVNSVFARPLTYINIGHADNEQNLQATNEISESLDEHQDQLSLETLTNCIFGLYDFNIDEEVAKALPNGTLNEVSRKICRKATEIKTCYHNMADALFEDQLKRSIDKNIWDNMVDFACFMNGDITTKFIQDGGIECITSKPEALSRTGCMNNSGNVSSIAQACAKYDEMSNCVVTTLGNCANTTPSNTARALFSYIRTKVLTPCSDNDV